MDIESLLSKLAVSPGANEYDLSEDNVAKALGITRPSVYVKRENQYVSKPYTAEQGEAIRSAMTQAKESGQLSTSFNYRDSGGNIFQSSQPGKDTLPEGADQWVFNPNTKKWEGVVSDSALNMALRNPVTGIAAGIATGGAASAALGGGMLGGAVGGAAGGLTSAGVSSLGTGQALTSEDWLQAGGTGALIGGAVGGISDYLNAPAPYDAGAALDAGINASLDILPGYDASGNFLNGAASPDAAVSPTAYPNGVQPTYDEGMGGWIDPVTGQGVSAPISPVLDTSGGMMGTPTAPVIDQTGGMLPDYSTATGAMTTPVTTTPTSPTTVVPPIVPTDPAWYTTAGGGLLAATGLNLAGGYLNQQAATDAAKTQADTTIEAAKIAAEAQKFKPVGVTTNFGKSNFTYDAAGNLTGGGYTLSPQLQAQQNQLMGMSGGLLNQFQGAQAATAPLGAGAQSAMNLGRQYLNTSPQEQAQKYYNDQQAVMSAGRASDMAKLQAQMQAQGRGGFAIGGGAGMGAANPQLQALLNAQLQQDRELAAASTQGGMDYAKFGAGMMGTGSELLNSMYGTQANAYKPYATAMGGAQMIEGLGQNAMDIGIGLGSKETAGRAQAGQLLASGMSNAANTIGNTAQQTGSMWGNILQGGGSAFNQYQQNQSNNAFQQQLFDALKVRPK